MLQAVYTKCCRLCIQNVAGCVFKNVAGCVYKMLQAVYTKKESYAGSKTTTPWLLSIILTLP
jgi:hypothetical protein